MNESLTQAFDPEVFRLLGHRMVDQLAEYLARATSGQGMPVLPWAEADQLIADWPDEFPDVPAADPARTLEAMLAKTIAQSIHLHHPRYVGHQVTSPLPQAAVCEMAATLLNNAMAVYEMGPVGTVMERSLVRWMGTQLGFDRNVCDGVFTSGGSAGNLTALLAARQDRAGFDIWAHGDTGGPPLATLAGASAHYSVQRAVQIMGWGRDGIIPVAVDERFKMRADDLEPALERGHTLGRKVIAVSASACSTATGSFDPLEAIAEFCTKHGLWLHVDGAHGAAASLSPKYRSLLAGIERADSVVWDAHKMLLMPALATAVIFRTGGPSFQTFAQHASYLFGGKKPEEEWYNVGRRTIECTKRMMSFQLYAALRLYGTRFFADYVTSAFDLGRRFGEMIQAEPDFELPLRPECNIVCFRIRPKGMADDLARLDALQARIRKKVVADGSFYLVQTQLPQGLFLRVTLINPITTEEDLSALLKAIRNAAANS